MILGIRVLNAPPPGSGIGIISDNARRKTGYAYHHRFNAETWSTYGRCVEELDAYLTEVGEPWFSEWRVPQQLLTHAELGEDTREALEAAIAGKIVPEYVAAALKTLGVKARGSKHTIPY
jgi:hypothetical protein